ncbi:MAG: hypothetical protein BWY05_01472 [Euryarchaeota archaeon ADurb.Bin165]|nr:MAG: hypothetical protein BWY05_01472 [Euryarchaeota archaeon ADurb.Bin165]
MVPILETASSDLFTNAIALSSRFCLADRTSVSYLRGFMTRFIAFGRDTAVGLVEIRRSAASFILWQ